MPWNPNTDMPNLSGKVVLVTGASVGIGFEIVRHLAQRGATVFATTRTVASAEKAQEKLRYLRPDLGDGEVKWLLLDLTNLSSISQTAKEIIKSCQRLDIVINNAATITQSKEIVAGRWEKNMAVNVLGPFLLINRISSLLESTSKLPGADVRVVNIASTAPTVFLPANFEYDFTTTAGLASPVSSYPSSWRYFARFFFSSDMILYSVSKAAVQMYTSQLQRFFDARGLSILSLSVHPGEVATEGVDAANGLFLRTMARLFFFTSEQGAATPLYVATAAGVLDEPERYKHKLVMPIGRASPLVSIANDEKQAHQMWNMMTNELNRHLLTEGLPPMQIWWDQ